MKFENSGSKQPEPLLRGRELLASALALNKVALPVCTSLESFPTFGLTRLEC